MRPPQLLGHVLHVIGQGRDVTGEDHDALYASGYRDRGAAVAYASRAPRGVLW